MTSGPSRMVIICSRMLEAATRTSQALVDKIILQDRFQGKLLLELMVESLLDAGVERQREIITLWLSLMTLELPII